MINKDDMVLIIFCRRMTSSLNTYYLNCQVRMTYGDWDTMYKAICCMDMFELEPSSEYKLVMVVMVD